MAPRKWHRWGLLALMAVWVVLGSGCTTIDAENESSRPWAQPRSWETGLPSGLLEGR